MPFVESSCGMRDPEIIIIGSGPAGCSTALHLAALSPAWCDRILVLEAKHHPRAKLCGGGVTVFGLRVLRGLGLTLDVPHVRVDEALFRLQRRTLKVRGQPLLEVVDRSSLDAWLMGEVRARGVSVEEESPVRAVEPSSSEVTVRTAAREYHPKAMVLACGSRGLDFVAWGAGGSAIGPRRVARAVESFASQGPVDVFSVPASVEFDFSPMAQGRHGYSWRFPMPGGAQPLHNLGLFDTRQYAARRAPDLKAGLEKYAGRTGVRSLEPIQGHPVRLYSPWARLSAPRLLLVGDAAGVDPLFGEGIGASLAYGRVAAQEIDRARSSGDYRFAGFTSRVLAGDLGDYLGVRWTFAQLIYGPAPLPGFTLLAWAIARLIAPSYNPRLA
jgi:flavin-dependent dehydrogenase